MFDREKTLKFAAAGVASLALVLVAAPIALPPKPQAPLAPTPVIHLDITVDALLEQRLFALADLPTAAPVAPTPVATPEPLENRLPPYTLTGIVETEEARIAIIEDRRNGRSSLFREGDRIEGSLIERIERTRVYLRRDEEEIILQLDARNGSLQAAAEGQ